MANPGSGSKFVSVNLNKSYGQQQQHHFTHHNNQHHTGSSRTRPGAAGGGGMLVLSRPRSSQKAAGPKLSVPPPLNLPSLRKEHERFDALGSGVGHSGGGPGSGSRPSSSGIGWNKPAAIVAQEKEGVAGDNNVVDGGGGNNLGVNQGLDFAGNGVTKENAGAGGSSGVYMPPSARSTGSARPVVSAPSGGYSSAEKATVLKGEDFPTLWAALPVTSGPEKKQKDVANQKQKRLLIEDLGNEQQKDGSHLNALVDMRPEMQSRNNFSDSLDQNGAANRGLGGSIMSQKDQKQEEYFPEPFPLVRLNPRSDWADDERDTGHGLADRGRDHGFYKTEPYWERDFDFPRPSILPQRPAQNLYEKQGRRDYEIGKISSNEVAKGDGYVRHGRMPSREGQEGNSWKTSLPVSRNGFSSQEFGNGRNDVGARSSVLNRETANKNKYIHSTFQDSSLDDSGRKDLVYGQLEKQPRNKSMDSFGNRALERNTQEHHGGEQFNRYRGDSHPNNSVSKSSFSLGSKGLPVNDPILNFGREKRPFANNEKHYLEDPFTTGFDGRDPFSGGLARLVNKKKDVPRQSDFHDPVRESFEAELERVQKMQELERQRIIEEQERASEQARREEEERMRLAREQQEQERRLEEEAREAAWRAEQERIEAMERAERQKIAREEEKHRILLEEERRKQAAKQKLLELEERIAKRHTEAAKNAINNNASGFIDTKVSGMMTEKDVSKASEVGDWEDGERMVESITMSVSSDLLGMTRPFDMGSRPHFSRDGSSVSSDRGKPGSPWKRDIFDNGSSSTFPEEDQDISQRYPMRAASVGGKAYTKKEFYGGPGLLPSRAYHKGEISDPNIDDFSQTRGHSWNISDDGDHRGRRIETQSEFHESFADRFGDAGWGQGRSHGRLYPPYHERMYQNSDADGHYSFGRSRYSMRQPRVLPPPSINSRHRNSYRGYDEHAVSSSFSENEAQYSREVRSGSATQTRFDIGHQDNFGLSETIDAEQEETGNVPKKLAGSTTRCDSQSSLSVSSPPDSPVHLSHDDLDESGDSPLLSVDKGKDDMLLAQGNETLVLPIEAGKDNKVSGSGILSAGEDEEWAIENDDQLQEQEEYDEDEDAYEDEDEVHDGEDENTNLTHEFQDMHLEEKGSSDMDNLVLGFNEGVEVGMPSDEFEKSSRNEETKFVMPPISPGALQEKGTFDAMCGDGQNPVDGPAQESMDTPSRIIQEIEKAMQDLVIQSKNTSEISATSELLNHVDASFNSGLSLQPQPSSLGQTAMSTVSSVASQSEVPVKLQFGLFSGPSLIPSPVPAIQIGSIQMPLHLYPPTGSSLSHVHPSQHLFQFGQLRYPSPISQGVVPLAQQSMSFMQPSVAANFSLNQNVGGSRSLQPGQDTKPHNIADTNGLSISRDNQSTLLPHHLDPSHCMAFKVENSLPIRESTDSGAKVEQSQGGGPHSGDGNLKPESGFLTAEHSVMKNLQNSPPSDLGVQHHTGSSASVSKEKDLGLSKGQGLTSGARGKRLVYAVKNSGPRPSFQASESYRQDSSGFQRRPRRSRAEFRVRETVDKRQASELVLSSPYGVDDKSNNTSGRDGARNGSRRGYMSDRQAKKTFESEGPSSQSASSQELDIGGREEKGAGKESSRKSQNIPLSREDVDAPLQSGIVRVFEQPGIEAPSDDDDFIEVRSKRQMLNDRREQREKEIKAKSRIPKIPRKHRSTLQSMTSVGGEASDNGRSNFVAAVQRGLPMGEASAGINAPIVTQPLPPIGTPAMKTDHQADIKSHTVKSLQTSSLPAVSGSEKNPASGLMFETKNKVLDNVQASLGTWGNSRINQQVISLTQTQLDDAMKPAQFDSHSSVGDPTTSASTPSLSSSSILTKEKLLSSTASPVNSLLAGEKIQFGAVTSPTLLPPSSLAISHGIGPPGSCQMEIPISHNLSSAEKDCSIFYEKKEHPTESSHLEDCEAEAEAAASAVAVAAISSDEIVGNGLGSEASGDKQLPSQTRAEESLSVALPADLSVETSPISLWAPLQSPQNSSSQMISHVPGGPPSHFPFREMNPMLGGPILAFGPQDESACAQSQSQKSNTPVSGPLGAWQHSGVDSFYGPPARFTGPFISPPASIPGVQGSHMVFYNHFAPVGQFGHLGLSFMGTYIPSAKQPDWKHIPASSSIGVAEGDMDMVSAQRNSSNMPPPVQHLAPGSPLLPMASPLAMFDMPPFQSSADMPVQARWSHVPASSLQPVSVSMPLQQQAEGVVPSQFNHGPAVDQTLAANRFPESRVATPSDNSGNFPVPTEPPRTQLPDELGLVDSSSNGAGNSTKTTVAKSASASTIPDAGKTDSIQNSSSSNSRSQSTNTVFKTQPSHQKNASTQQYGNSAGYSYQRAGAVSQKNSSGSEWSHRRMGYQPRNQPLGAEKNFTSSKTKQIYVAKQSTSGTPTAS